MRVAWLLVATLAWGAAACGKNYEPEAKAGSADTAAVPTDSSSSGSASSPSAADTTMMPRSQDSLLHSTRTPDTAVRHAAAPHAGTTKRSTGGKHR